MISRTFRAETMIEALAQVQKDLGADALVVTARQIPGGEPWQVWRKPLVEVVAVKLEPGEEAPKTSNGSKKPAQSSKPDLSNKDAGSLKHTKSASAPSTPRPASQPVGSSARVAPASTIAPAEDNHQQDDTEFAAETLKEDVVEIKGKKVRSQPAGEPRLNLLHQLGQNETLEDVRIIQVQSAVAKQLEQPSIVPSTLILEQPKSAPQPVEGAWPELQKVYYHLLDQGLDAGLAKRVCQISADTLGVQTAMDQKKLEAYIRRQLEASIKVQLETPRNEGKVIFLVGPSGAGKTSFAAKLAARYRKEMQKSVTWVCADTVRTGGIAEARAFTEAINIPMQIAYSPHECASIVQSLSGTGLVIVDTPAANPRNEESMVETGALLTSVSNRVTWLVVPATAKEADLVNTAAAFSVFKPGALVVTKMDETDSFGGVYNLAMRTQLPLAYFCSGPRVLDDLHPAAASRLVQSLFTERFGQ
jgi:flagellar biosynthesis protein FlhF